MEKMQKLCETVEREFDKFIDKGFTTSNIDNAYKLVDIYKNIKNIYYWDTKSEYYDAVLSEMQSNYSEDDYSMRGRKRDSQGRYSRDDGMSYDNGGQSYARGRNNRGRNQYSRDDGYPMNDGYSRYMDAKQSYRNNQSMDGKKRLMDSLEDYMDDFTDKIKEMHRDADSPEEREMISKFMTKLQNIR